MTDAPLLKDFVTQDSIEAIGDAIAAVSATFDVDKYVAEVLDDEWPGRALKQRIRHIAVTARTQLPDDYVDALKIMSSAAEHLTIGGIPVWCFNDFVEEYGVDFPDESLPALEQFTKLASAEFAVRPFINRYPERMAAQMLAWAHSDDEDVRRLASEGFRPLLPWGMGIPALKTDPTPVIPVLETLRDDPSETVRRSVANNLNDISKIQPDRVVSVLTSWGADSPEAIALRNHALRTLLKKGDSGALELLDFRTDLSVSIEHLSVEPAQATVGGHATLNVEVRSTASESQKVMFDYAVVFQNKSGTGSRKVFKGKVMDFGAGESTSLRRKINLKPMTTRQILPGPHKVEVQLNGVVHGVVDFDVVE